MKKNILVTQLLLLPLITSSLILSMEYNEQVRGQSRKQKRYQIRQQNAAIKRLAAMEKNKLQPQTTKNAPVDLLQSVMIPTEEKGLGALGTFCYYMNDPIKNITSYLTTNTFDKKNASHFKLLDEAITEAISRKDFDVLMNIVALCQSTEDYRKSIRIPDKIAEIAFDFCSKTYISEIVDSNKTIKDDHQNSIAKYNAKTAAFSQTINQAIDLYRRDLNNITSQYALSTQKEADDIADMKIKMIQLSALNARFRSKTDINLHNSKRDINLHNIMIDHKITTPVNNFTHALDLSEKQLSLLSATNFMPRAEDAGTTLSNNLQLTNNK